MYHTKELPDNNLDDLKNRGQHHFINVPDPKNLNVTKTATDLRDSVKKIGNERVIGDSHFFDENIIQMAPRNFTSVEEMNASMIDSWNSVTAKNDTVFHLGDFINFGNCSVEEGFEIIDQLNGNIVLIAGNHDLPYLNILREYGPRLQVIEYPILKNEFWILSHDPQFVSEAAPYANIFAHVHLNPMYKDVSSRSFCVSAERLGYKPILLREAMGAVRNYKES